MSAARVTGSSRVPAPPGAWVAPAIRRQEGNDEPIIDPELAIIDAHHHLYDRSPDAKYLLDDYADDIAQGHHVVASVYIEIMAMARVDGPELLRPLGEVEFANGVAAMSASGRYGSCRVAAAIVGHADLRYGKRVGELLDASMSAAPTRYRGIRQVVMDYPDPALVRYTTNPPPQGILDHPHFLEGLREVSDRGLSFDAAIFHHQLPAVEHLATQFPDLQVVLNHVGLPLLLNTTPAVRKERIERWRADLRKVALRPNVACKISGLGQAWLGFGLDTQPDPVGYLQLADKWSPFIREAVDAFGPDRCMVGSNFPVDARSCGIVPYWNAMKHILRHASPTEKQALFSGTAARIYGVPRPRDDAAAH